MHNTRLFVALLFFFILSSGLWAVDTKRAEPTAESEQQSLGKVTSIVDETPEEAIAQRAKGYLLKGELKTMTANTGKIVGHDFSNWSNPEGLYKGFQYLAAVGMMVGVNGARNDGPQSLKDKYPWSYRPHPTIPDSVYWWGPTVSESHFDRTNNLIKADWMPIKDHRGRLHSGMAISSEVTEYQKWAALNDQTPILATSDKPLSWPTGYYDSNGEWCRAPSAEYKDLTDEERAVVDSLKAQWDEENEVWHFWPGPWARDPNPNSPTFQQPMPGSFYSDVDIFMAFDDRWAIRDIDKEQGYSMGVEVQCSGFSYGRSFAEDIIFFPVKLINKSDKVGIRQDGRKFKEATNNGQGWNYKDMYVGFYFDVDAYNKQADGNLAGRTNDDDMMAYNQELDFAYIWDLDDESGGFTGMAYTALKFLDSPPAAEALDIDNDGVIDIQKGDKLGLTDWHWFDWYARPGVRSVETNSGPFAGDGTTPVARNKEEVMYRVMSGDTTGLTESQKDWYFWHGHKATTDNLHFNSLEHLFADYPNGLDCTLIASAGPFDLALGDTVNASFSIIMGDSPIDLEQNAEIAQLMYDNNYQGPNPPKAPKVEAVVSQYKDETGTKRNKVTLFWDRRSETSTDVMTGYNDFEGYRVYKSTDGGETWGDPKRDLIRDELGIARTWKPIAQCDKIDGIGGRDLFAPWIYLGDDERDENEGQDGLFHSFTDYDVKDGVTYSYSVTAYDYGIERNNLLLNPLQFQFNLESLENFRGNSVAEPQFVEVTPQPPPSDFVDVKIDTSKDGTVKRIVGSGLAKISVDVVDPYKVTGHKYRILFRDSTISTMVPKLDSVAVDTLYGRLDTLVVYDHYVDSSTVKSRTTLVYNVKDMNTGKWIFVNDKGEPQFSDRIYSIDGSAAGVGLTIDSLNTGLIDGTEYAPVFDGMRLKITNVANKPYFRRAVWSSDCNWELSFEKWAEQTPKDYMLVWNRSFPDSAYQLEGTNINRIPLNFKAYDITNGKNNPEPVDAVWMDIDREPLGEFSSNDVLGFIENADFFQTPNGVLPRGTKTWRLKFTWYEEDQWVVFPADTLIRESTDPETGEVYADTTVFPADSMFVRESKDWANGDTLFITTWKPLSTADKFEFDTQPYSIDEEMEGRLANIRVVPNPYIVSAAWETDPNHLKLQFTNLPKKCDIYIFNLAGELINTLEHYSPDTEPGTGTEDWNLWTVNRQEVAAGLYVYVVQTPDGEKKMGKFAIIR